MKRAIFFVLSVGFVYAGIAFSFGRIDLRVRGEVFSEEGGRHFRDYSGVINVHSERSSGSGTYSDIHEAANAAGLDFIVITDTNDFDVPLERESYLNDTLLLVGAEYSFVDSRLMILNFSEPRQLKGRGHSQVIFNERLSRAESSEGDGFLILSHPFKPGFQMPNPLPVGLNGLEILNLESVWQLAWINKRSSFLWALFLYPINVEWSFSRLFASYTHPEMGLWNEENLKRPLVGYAGADADSNTRMPWGIWKFPSYQTYFSILRNHLLLESDLTGNLENDRKKIMSALEKGQFYVSLDLIGNAKGFETYLVGKDSKLHPLGSRLVADQVESIVVDLAEKPKTEFKVILYRDGEPVMSSDSLRTEMQVHSKGVYRAMVQIKMNFPFEEPRWMNWIITNHFYLN